MYRVSRTELARLVNTSSTVLDGYFNELAPLHAELAGSVSDLPAAGALWQAPLLYVLVRAARPSWLLETGISSGYSSRFLLEALERNGLGRLDSVGLNELALGNTPAPTAQRAAGRPAGWLVPPRLSHRWTRHIGRSEEVLPRLLNDAPPRLDLFLHDSAHVFPTMMAEYSLALPHLAPLGFLLSHDVHTTAAWPDFLRQAHLRGDAELDHDLGAVRLPGAPG